MKKWVFLIISVLIVIILLAGCEIETTPIKDKKVTGENVIECINELNIKLRTQDLVEGKVPERPTNTNQTTIMYELPDIDNYEPIVKGKSSNNVEVFLPLETSTGGIESVVVRAANIYNSTHDDSSITIRSLENALAEDFIQYGAYTPDGYISPNTLYEYTLNENGIKAEKVTNRLLGNTVGIVIKKNMVSNKLKQDYETIGYDGIFKACMDGNLTIGYLNPVNNPTGMNFVVSMLSYFDSSNPFSMEATVDFSQFQSNCKIYYSLEQMIEALNRESIDCLCMDYQSFVVDQSMTSFKDKSMAGFLFIPFGVRQDYPLLAIGDVSEEKMVVLKEFSNLFFSPEILKLAGTIGYNQNDDYVSTIETEYYDGIMNAILDFWKVDRSSNKKIAVYFVCDVSGSMQGRRIKALKESALNAMQYIGEDCLVGIISYNSGVYHSLPLGKFDEQQQKYFAGAIESMGTGGNTATNDAILMALKELAYKKNLYKDYTSLIILLSDGETNVGYSLNAVRDIIAVFDTPIYTIGYEANVRELKSISDINNGVFINASTDDVGYILKNLFNAEM